jgi:2-polyprenyl-3-methyl-5-hydroxy-6-metoxy-1,4-benzoquinol methylase
MFEVRNLPPEVKIESKPCPNGCDVKDNLLFYAHDRFHGLKGDFPVVKCGNCDLVRTNPRPDLNSLAYYYPDDYGPYKSTLVNLGENEKEIPLLKKIVRKIFDTKSTALPKLKPGKMLEVGCASGSFMHKMAKEGWDVCGIEFSESAADMARKLGYKVHTGPLETAPDDYSKIDMVAMWVVIEHLSDPVSAVKKIHSYLNEDGWFCLSTHNVRSYMFKKFKEDYYDNHIPNHLYHFSDATLTDFLEKNGFSVEKVIHNRLLQNLTGSIAFRLLSRNPESKLAQKLLNLDTRILYFFFPITWFLSLIGHTGRMTIWARKKAVV